MILGHIFFQNHLKSKARLTLVDMNFYKSSSGNYGYLKAKILFLTYFFDEYYYIKWDIKVPKLLSETNLYPTA